MNPDLLVYAVLAAAGGVIVAWTVSPQLRARIERPKHLFLEDLRRYDRDGHG